VAIREKLCKRNRMFVENDQSALWNYCMRMIYTANCMQWSAKFKLKIFMGKFNTEWNLSGKVQGLKHKKFWDKKVNISSNLSSNACYRNCIYTHITPWPLRMLCNYCYCSRTLMFKLNIAGKSLLRKILKVARHRRIGKW
jgi:hypothetical protein